MQNQITTIKAEMKKDFETSMAKQNNELKNMMASFFQMQSPLGSGSLPSNTVANPRVEREPEATKDKVQTTNLGSTAHVQPPVVQVLILEPDVAPKPNPKPSIPYPSRLNDQKLQEKANNQIGGTTSTPDSFPSLTPVETSDSLLEEFSDELALLDPFPPGIGDAEFDPEGDILLLEKLLNDDPSSPPPLKELNFEELKMIKSSIDDSPPLDFLGGNSVTFSNPLSDSNEDFTSSNDESPPEEDVPEENFKIYLNPLFEFDEEYISSDVNPLFNEVLEDIESKDSYVSNLDEQALLVTPLSDANEDECFDPRGDIDEIDAFLYIEVYTDIEDGYHDSEGDIIYLESFLINDTIPNLSPKEF
ncbi:hypothetical protein Tco_1386872 [Tanacetum coccineum]